MPPHGEMTMDDQLPVSSQKKRSSDKKRREKSGSSSDKKRREKSGSSSRRRREKQSQNEDTVQEEMHRKRNSKSKSKKKSTKKSSSQGSSGDSNNKKSSTRNHPPPPSKTKPKAEGVTVSQFLTKQQQFQNEASSRKSTTLRQKMMQEQHRNMIVSSGAPQSNQEGEGTHYFDDDSDCDDDHQNDQAVVRHNSNSNHTASAPHTIVDCLPADHPSSSTIQTHRTCTLCHRTLPRAQFSERDRFTVNLSISPGVTCRTCSMTVCAVRLKSMPGTESLLLEYAQKGMAQGLLALEQGEEGNIAGYLEASSNGNDMMNSDALVVRENSTRSVIGKELTLYGDNANGNTNNSKNSNNNNNIMGLNNPNAPFSGHAYSHSDADRPTHVADCKYIDALLQMPCYLNLNAFGLFTTAKDASVSLAALEAVRVYGTLEEGYFVPHDCDGQPVLNQNDKKGGEETTRRIGNGTSPEVNTTSTALIVLNEGPTPRTAILASQHYGWQTYAIDPTLSKEWDGYHNDIPNFTGYSGTLEEFMDSSDSDSALVEFAQKQNVKHLVVIGIQPTANSLRLKKGGHINEIRSRYNDVPTTLVSMSPIRKTTLVPRQRTNGRGYQECGSKLEGDVGYEPNCSYLDEGVFSECRMVEVWNFHNAEDDDGSEGSGSEGSYDGEEYSQEEYEGEDGQYDEGEGGYYPEETNESEHVQKEKNRGQRQQAEEEHHNAKKPSFDEQLQSLHGNEDTRKSASRRANKHKKDTSQNKTRRKSAFLEERVAQFKNENQDDENHDNDDGSYEHEQEEHDGREKSAFLEERVAQFKNDNQDNDNRDNDDGSYEHEQDEHHGREVEHNSIMDSSLSTLGTKGACDRKLSMGSKGDFDQKSSMGSDMIGFDRTSSLDSGDVVDGRNKEQQESSRQEKRSSNQDVANHSNNDYQEQDEEKQEQEEETDSMGTKEAAVWSPPDEEVANQVWEKALAKHDVQESLCDQFESFNYKGEDGDNDNNDSQDADQDHQEYDEDHQHENHQEEHGNHQQENPQEEHDNDYQEENDSDYQEEHDGNQHDDNQDVPEDPENVGLPPNWEAIRDPSSGDPYYNNWETGEVTWDRPGGNQAQQDQDLPPMSPLEDGGVEDNHGRHDDSSEGSRSTTQSYDQIPAGAAIATPAAAANACSGFDKDQRLDDITASDHDCDSNYVFDDMSSTSSGIGALTNWNAEKGKSHTTNVSREAEDDMIFWSDDNEEGEEGGDLVGKTLRRKESTSSSKRQPWHRKDSSSS